MEGSKNKVHEGKNATMCCYCLKKMAKRHLKRHESRCKAADISLPDGYRVEKGVTTTYSCSCGYKSRRSRIFEHIKKYHSGKSQASQTVDDPSSPSNDKIKMEEISSQNQPQQEKLYRNSLMKTKPLLYFFEKSSQNLAKAKQQ